MVVDATQDLNEQWATLLRNQEPVASTSAPALIAIVEVVSSGRKTRQSHPHTTGTRCRLPPMSEPAHGGISPEEEQSYCRILQVR